MKFVRIIPYLLIPIAIATISYYAYSVYRVRNTVTNARAFLCQIEIQVNDYITTHPEYLTRELTNYSLGLPTPLKYINSAVTSILLSKATNGHKVYIIAQLNRDFLPLLPFTTPAVAPFVQIQINLSTEQTSKRCYSNLSNIYLSQGCTHF